MPAAQAVVIRDDVADARYLAEASEIPALADLPGEGHGVLIAPSWVITVAHAVRGQASVPSVVIAGIERTVSKIVYHPGYRALPDSLQSGDAAPTMAFLMATDDVALIRLAQPVTDVEPIPLYRERDELGQQVRIYGKGATGNGATGQTPGSPHRGMLRRADNRISDVTPRLIGYRFDRGDAALPLEGQLGNGDSGSPVLLGSPGHWQLVGLADWKHWQGDLSGMRAGIYGQLCYNVRISHYIHWIGQTTRQK